METPSKKILHAPSEHFCTECISHLVEEKIFRDAEKNIKFLALIIQRRAFLQKYCSLNKNVTVKVKREFSRK